MPGVGCLGLGVCDAGPDPGAVWRGNPHAITDYADRVVRRGVRDDLHRLRSAPADGPVSGLIGLYGEYGSPVLSTSRIEQNRLLSNRYPVELDTMGAQIIEVFGQLSAGKLSTNSWKPLVWTKRPLAVAQAYLDQVAPALASYDWARIARPDFANPAASIIRPRKSSERFPLISLGMTLLAAGSSGGRKARTCRRRSRWCAAIRRCTSRRGGRSARRSAVAPFSRR